MVPSAPSACQSLKFDHLRAAYERDGFCVAPQVIPPEVVQAAIIGMDQIRAGIYDTGFPPEESPWKPGDDPNKLCKIEMPHVASKGVREAVCHPAVGELAAAVTGANMVQVWWVQLLYKPPGGKQGTNVGWHQDLQYWKVWEPDSELLTIWLAISDVTEESGAVRFVPGSHRWGLLDQGDFFEQSQDQQVRQLRLPEGARWVEVAATMPAGGASVHHCLTYHGSGPNLSSGPRRSFAIHLRTDRARALKDVSHVRLEDGRNLTKYLDDPYYNPIIFTR